MQPTNKTCPIWQPARRVAAFGSKNEQQPDSQKKSRRSGSKTVRNIEPAKGWASRGYTNGRIRTLQVQGNYNTLKGDRKSESK